MTLCPACGADSERMHYAEMRRNSESLQAGTDQEGS